MKTRISWTPRRHHVYVPWWWPRGTQLADETSKVPWHTEEEHRAWWTLVSREARFWMAYSALAVGIGLLFLLGVTVLMTWRLAT